MNENPTTELLAELTAERYGCNRWWTRKPKPTSDDQMTGRRRLAACVAEDEARVRTEAS